VITLGSIINGTDYMRTGLSLEDLGLAGMDRAGLARYLEDG